MSPQTKTVEFPSSSKSSEKNTVHPACLAARLMSASENEKLCNRWKIDGGQDITAVGTEDIELRQEFELQSESQGLVYVYRHKIFLQNLHPENTTTTTSAFCYGSEGTAPLGRADLIIGTDEYVGVKKLRALVGVVAVNFEPRESRDLKAFPAP